MWKLNIHVVIHQQGNLEFVLDNLSTFRLLESSELEYSHPFYRLYHHLEVFDTQHIVSMYHRLGGFTYQDKLLHHNPSYYWYQTNLRDSYGKYHLSWVSMSENNHQLCILFHFLIVLYMLDNPNIDHSLIFFEMECKTIFHT